MPVVKGLNRSKPRVKEATPGILIITVEMLLVRGSRVDFSGGH